MKQIKALTIAFWNVCKQLPGALSDELAHINDLRGRINHIIVKETTQGTAVPSRISKMEGMTITELSDWYDSELDSIREDFLNGKTNTTD